MPPVLIADSGSTKTTWALVQEGKATEYFHTVGINPYLISMEEVVAILKKEFPLPPQDLGASAIYFYSAGVRAKKNKEHLEKTLQQYFQNTRVSVLSDLVGAARATCNRSKGVVCILGTGSNSCFYNGEKIAKQHPSLGYVIGDEGGGAYLGKKVLQYYFYSTFDAELKGEFEHQFDAKLENILEQVYRQPFPNRYLATFTQFLATHRGHYMVENILEDAFMDFFTRHVLKYRESWKYPVNFVGSVSCEFKDVLKSLIDQYGLEAGTVLKEPIEGLVKYHQHAAEMVS